ncbi:MAG: TonB-dependent receptor, partial [Prevotella sp.]|nr:TonB-dependent receptor [Prevotella sp.]
MQKKLKLAVIALCYASLACAQTEETQAQKAATMDESAFTFTEAQLGDNDDMSQNVTIISSNNNLFANSVGFLFSPVRFRYRSFSQKYNDVHVNGVLLNDMETGQFRFSQVGGLNQMTRNADNVLAFENGCFDMSNMGGSVNYNFRASNFAAGHRLAMSAANRNYTLRGMYTYSSGLTRKGWAVTANVTYRWANRGYVEGTFYNALSYFLGVEKIWGNHHLSLATWGNPTERSTQGASTDEAYWMANNQYYNPYWGYQNGEKRNSRVVNDFAPSAIMTWDWQINDDMKLTTSLFGRLSWYKSTKLNYNNSDNPQPDYWKLMPSSYY